MKKLVIKCAELEIQGEDIIKIKLFDDYDFEKKDAEDIIHAINTISGGKSYYLLTLTGKHFTATTETREYMAGAISSTGIIANAICLSSLPIRLIINVYVRLNKPTVPTKTFNSEVTAIEWINDFRIGFLEKSSELKNNDSKKSLLY